MNLTHWNSKESGTLFRLVWRLALVVTLAGYLTMVTTAQSGSRLSCPLSQFRDGTSVFLSCGGSGGNFLYVCQGGVCTPSGGDDNQVIANEQCRQYTQDGCPEVYIEQLEQEPVR